MSISSTTTDPLANSRWDTQETVEAANNNALDQEDFLALLTKQLAYQDPFKPVDNDQMISQMASFATVDGINSMAEQFGSLNEIMTSSQALQASTLVGQKVLVPSDTGYLAAGGTMEGVLTSSENMKNVTVRIEDESGQLIKTIDMKDLAAGNNKITWDGTNNTGEAVKEGNYVFKAQALVGGERVDLAVAAYASVDSVTLGSAASGGVVLNLQGLGGIRLSDVLEVAKA